MSWLETLFRVKDPDEQRMQFLGKVKLFENLVLGDIDFLLDELREEQYDSGEWVFHEGEPGNSLYIVEEGEVEILKENEGGEDTSLARLKPGDFFGEMSLIRRGTRSASVRATKRSVLLFLSEENFRDMLSRNHRTSLKITYNIARVLSDRLDEMNEKLDRAEQSVS